MLEASVDCHKMSSCPLKLSGFVISAEKMCVSLCFVKLSQRFAKGFIVHKSKAEVREAQNKHKQSHEGWCLYKTPQCYLIWGGIPRPGVEKQMRENKHYGYINWLILWCNVSSQ